MTVAEDRQLAERIIWCAESKVYASWAAWEACGRRLLAALDREETLRDELGRITHRYGRYYARDTAYWRAADALVVETTSDA